MAQYAWLRASVGWGRYSVNLGRGRVNGLAYQDQYLAGLARPDIVCGVMKTYSMHKAKAHFSEIIRQVREGETVTVTYRGKPVAEIRPMAEPTESTATFESWWEEMVRKGIIVPSNIPTQPRRPKGHIPGALERFLADRG